MKEEQKKSGRPPKYDAEYFPHFCNHNRTLEIIVDKYGNEGYAFFYRLQELLGRTPSQGYDAYSDLKYEYLLSKTGVDHEKADEIITLLCDFGEIDAMMWNDEKLIWWQNFVDSLKVLYKKRKNELPTKIDFFKKVMLEKGPNQHPEIHKVKESKANNTR